jgi:hypothetical protein
MGQWIATVIGAIIAGLVVFYLTEKRDPPPVPQVTQQPAGPTTSEPPSGSQSYRTFHSRSEAERACGTTRVAKVIDGGRNAATYHCANESGLPEGWSVVKPVDSPQASRHGSTFATRQQAEDACGEVNVTLVNAGEWACSEQRRPGEIKWFSSRPRAVEACGLSEIVITEPVLFQGRELGYFGCRISN